MIRKAGSPFRAQGIYFIGGGQVLIEREGPVVTVQFRQAGAQNRFPANSPEGILVVRFIKGIIISEPSVVSQVPFVRKFLVKAITHKINITGIHIIGLLAQHGVGIEVPVGTQFVITVFTGII